MHTLTIQKNNIILIILVCILFPVSFVSCHYQDQTLLTRSSKNAFWEGNKDTCCTPSNTVEGFMSLAEIGKLDEAMQLFTKDAYVAANNEQNAYIDESSLLNWAEILHDRNLILKKIVDEEIEKDEAIVNAELQAKDMPKAVFIMKFHLRKINQEWKIFAVDLTPKKS